jgi:hypothetical protein
MGLAWRAVTSRILSSAWSSLLAATVCLFGLYLAIDSWRNDTTVSYGALWGVLFIGMAMLLLALFKDRGRRLRTWRGVVAFGLAILVVVGVARRDYGKLPKYANATEKGPPWLPSGWIVAPGVTVHPQVGQVSVTTTALPYGYQLESQVLTLPAGSYKVTARESTESGGFDLGVLREDTQSWIGQKAVLGHHRRAAISVSLSLMRRTDVRVILSNYSPRGAARSVWTVRGISLSAVSYPELARTWTVGFRPSVGQR